MYAGSTAWATSFVDSFAAQKGSSYATCFKWNEHKFLSGDNLS